MEPQKDSLLMAAEAAEFLSLKVATIRRMTSQGDIHVVHPTGKRAVRYQWHDLEGLVQVRRTPMGRRINS
jgi:hypothetical protein